MRDGAGDDLSFEITYIEDIRATDEYPGIRVGIRATYPPLDASLYVDVTTGDAITPGEVSFGFPTMFDGYRINMFAYPLETVLAEKLETVLSRETSNARPRDFYDIHVLWKLYGAGVSPTILREAISRTMERRKTGPFFDVYESIISRIQASERMRLSWDKYRKEYGYAAEIDFETAIPQCMTY